MGNIICFPERERERERETERERERERERINICCLHDCLFDSAITVMHKKCNMCNLYYWRTMNLFCFNANLGCLTY